MRIQIFEEVTEMCNAMMIAMTRKQEDGYDSYNENEWELPRYKTVKVKVHGTIRVFNPKEAR